MGIMHSDATRTRRSALVVLTSLLAAMAVAGCAQVQLDAPASSPGGSGSSVPGAAPINYHGFPYDIQAG